MNHVSRRHFISGLGAGAGLLLSNRTRAATPPGPALPSAPTRRIDAHAHIGFGPSLRLPVDRLLRAADTVGIERLAISVPSGPLPIHVKAANDAVLSAMKAHPDRLLGQCCVNPLYGREALEEIKRCLGEGMCGLGELYTYAKANDPVYFPLVEYCITQHAPMLWHCRADLAFVRPGQTTKEPLTTTTAADLVALAARYPEAILIHGHIGGGGDWEYMCKTLRAAPSVFLDTSGSVSEAGMIDFAVKTLGAERLLFATDMNFEAGVGKILAATLTDTQRRQIFADNFNGLLRRRGLHAY